MPCSRKKMKYKGIPKYYPSGKKIPLSVRRQIYFARKKLKKK